MIYVIAVQVKNSKSVMEKISKKIKLKYDIFI